MDTTPRIRLSPPNDALPRPAPAPVDSALRWDSPYENGEIQPSATVFLTQPAYARIYVHAASDLDNEVGGILVGQWCLDTGTESHFLVIENVLPARYTRQSGVHLTFTQDSLVHFHSIIERRFKGKQIVGWYHTHPRMGIFLSHYDTWLHHNFFPEAWQVALVVEPHTSIGGFFIRQNGGLLDPARYFGFYEMNGRLGHSTVRWQNLSCSGEESE
ncbi:MAG: Mov34/MPN/PAD-1 family protein [Anaerolineales bacterium]|nr:Mov34/MPN/PAD-1 family protein [Anaerolineales bacterium]